MGAGRDLYGLRKDRTEFPIEIGLNPFRSGGRLLVVASVIDISERKRYEEHIRSIMDELSHRSKNLLMVVLAIANQTVEHATSFGEFQANFGGRLLALARSHDLLVEKGWSGASIEALIFAQLKPFMDERAARLDVAVAGVATLAAPAVLRAQTRGRLVVIGGGFGGASAARFARISYPQVDVTLIEPQAKFITCPYGNLLLEGSRTLGEITHSYDGLKARGVRIVQDWADGIDATAKTVRLRGGRTTQHRNQIAAIDQPRNGTERRDVSSVAPPHSSRLPNAYSAVAFGHLGFHRR